MRLVVAGPDAAAVRAAGADVAACFGAPRAWRWRSRAAKLAREAELTYLAGGGTTGGVLLLAALRTRVLAARELAGGAVAALEVGGERWVVGAALPAAAAAVTAAGEGLGAEELVLLGPSGLLHCSAGARVEDQGGGVLEVRAAR